MGPRVFPLVLILPLVFSLLALPLSSSPAPAVAAAATVTVLTQHNDNDRSGSNLDETILNTTNVNPRQFGKLFTREVDGQIYAQPLYVPNLTLPGQGTHNVVFVATMHNSVYAFDADDPLEPLPLWHVQLGPPIPIPSPCFGDKRGPYEDIQKEVGIVSTPVIDLATHTMYVVTASQDGSSDTACDPDTYFHRLHALDLTTGREKFGGPVVIQASTPGTGPDSDLDTITFDSMQELQRPALLLANGMVYLGFGSYGAVDPYHGWLLAYNATTLAQEAVFLATPVPEKGDRYQGGIWQSGEGPSADDQGNIFVTTGNGYWNVAHGGQDYGDTVLRLRSTLSVADWFTPFNEQILDNEDLDLGATGPLLIPGTHLLLQVGKAGVLYLLNQYNLGHWQAGSDSQIVQSLHATISLVHASPACWTGPQGTWCYLWGALDFLKAFALVNGKFQASADGSGYAVPVSQSSMPAPSGVPGGMLSISSHGTTPGTGIVWATTPLRNANWADGAGYPARLRCHGPLT